MAIQQNDYEAAKEAAIGLRDLFGAENFFLEVAITGYEAQRKVTLGLKKLGEELGIPCVATNDVHYLKQEDHFPYGAWVLACCVCVPHVTLSNHYIYLCSVTRASLFNLIGQPCDIKQNKKTSKRQVPLTRTHTRN